MKKFFVVSLSALVLFSAFMAGYSVHKYADVSGQDFLERPRRKIPIQY